MVECAFSLLSFATHTQKKDKENWRIWLVCYKGEIEQARAWRTHVFLFHSKMPWWASLCWRPVDARLWLWLQGAEVLGYYLATDLGPFVLHFICLSPVLLKTATTNFNWRWEGKGVIYWPPKTPTARAGFEERLMVWAADGLDRKCLRPSEWKCPVGSWSCGTGVSAS